ncbi:MFS transporter [Kibdelosporangium aridum]|uniref:MFS transporter, DHA2 family, multidrug resistance protein n=1 Tax=Kibdelosporangium aridum TaxID=2030 RepID=A0A1Y5Y4Y8_KIBAR|nr:MFS transporter [Kibdelosporangium aridum]SMD25888.1 MFS transporter, DHA2 family, multidrug resistance protein [Kibdelosporangium aridum]
MTEPEPGRADQAAPSPTDTAMRAGPKEWIGLAVVTAASMLIAMDNTVLFLSLPHITADLDASAPQMLWIQDIYGFLVAGLLITMGTVGDRIGRKRLLMVGAAVFGAASLMAAYSTSAEMLILARGILGIAGAALVPTILGIIGSLFVDPKQRTRAIAVLMICFTAGGALGPLVGGVLLEHFWWGAVFIVAVPVMVLVLLITPLLLAGHEDTQPGKLDLPSVGLSLVSILPITYGFKELASYGPSWLVLISIVAGAAFTVLFARRQFRLETPLLDLRLFSNRSFSVSLGALLLGQFAIGGMLFLLPQFFQLVLGETPLQAGLWLLPGTVVFAAVAMIAPTIAAKVPRDWLLAGTLALAAVGYIQLALVGPDADHWQLVAAMIAMFAGMAPLVLLVTDLAVASAPPERAGAAAAMSSTSTEFGIALGVAALGSVLTAVYTRVLGPVPAGVSDTQAAAAGESLARATNVAGQLPEPAGAQLLSVARDAFVTGFNVVGIISATVAIGAAIAVKLLLRNVAKPADAPAEAPAEHSESQNEDSRT